jgi:toxin YoeB
MRQIAFESDAFQDFTDWANTNKKIYQRIVTLIKDILRQPFTGIGKPEPLKQECKAIGHDGSMMNIVWFIR